MEGLALGTINLIVLPIFWASSLGARRARAPREAHRAAGIVGA